MTDVGIVAWDFNFKRVQRSLCPAVRILMHASDLNEGPEVRGERTRTRCFSQQFWKEAWQRRRSPHHTHTAPSRRPDQVLV